jgi:hypothetical protein
MILAGTTADKMRGIYTRPHRNSIYEPATIHDIPFEVLRESFIHLVKKFDHDLASPSLACRAWRVVALDMMNSRNRFIEGEGDIESFVSGLHLRSIVGLERCTIKHLTIDLEFIEKEFIPIIARFLASTLSNLALWFKDQDADQSSDCYDGLDAFLNQCDGIRNLRFMLFDFGDDPTAISQTVKDGFCRLNQLDMIDCRGDIRMFVENTPIHSLETLSYQSDRGAEEEEDIISLIATKYRTLTSVKLIAKFNSSILLLKIVKCCRDLKRIYINPRRNILMLNQSDILAVASLPHLKSLDLYNCETVDDAFSALSRCRGLNELRIDSLANPAILAAIGMNLLWLNLWRPSKLVVDGIVDYCPNLQYLELEEVKIDEEVEEGLVGSLKSGLTKLAKFKLNEKSVRLGTDCEGY